MNEPVHNPNIARVIRIFETMPYVKKLGMTVMELRYGHGQMRVAWSDQMIGNPKTGVVHGGVVTSFLDTLCGLVVMASVPENTPLATLDLRIDYLRPALSKRDIFGSAECYAVTESIAFVRGFAYQENVRKPIANCTGSFILGATGGASKEQQPC